MQKVSAWSLFLVFAKMGAFTIGGGYAMIPLIEKELTSRGWISEDEISELIVLAQSAPGILAVNMAIYTGYKLSGLKGAVLSTLGAVLPSFVIILLIAAFFTNFKDNALIANIFRGVRPVAIALILVPAIRMAQKGCYNVWTWLLLVATLLAIAFLAISPIWIIIVTIALSTTIATLKQRQGHSEKGKDHNDTREEKQR